MWVSSHATLLFTQLRALFDFIQVIALSLLINSRAFPWFFVRVSTFAHVTWLSQNVDFWLNSQSAVLAVAGGGLGGGLGTATWQPFLCTVSRGDPFWPQLAVTLVVIPLAAATATVSQLWSKVVWNSPSAGERVRSFCRVACPDMRLCFSVVHAVRLSTHTWPRRFILALFLWLSAVSVSVMRSAITALTSSREDAPPSLARSVVAVTALCCFGYDQPICVSCCHLGVCVCVCVYG